MKLSIPETCSCSAYHPPDHLSGFKVKRYVQQSFQMGGANEFWKAAAQLTFDLDS